MNRLARILDTQYAHAWSLMDEIVNRFPVEAWRSASPAYFAPSRLTYHTIETVDYYCRDDLAAFRWGHRFGVDWDTASSEELPEQEAIRDYQRDVHSAASLWIHHLGDDGLLAPDAVFSEEGMTHLDRALYALRHTHQHLGELSSELRRRDLPRPPWR
ncbi:hypothetical protein ACFL6M_02990 [Candidatus Eisenbacteria bacterium]|uniref:DinB-like domain-containing protein n=1 Tax=Eiseniibacteriota bacterium TaxID=2212470 RepID=A0ABV6YK40_UNCEI